MTDSHGTLALVGAGEFLPSMRDVDAELLRLSGGWRVAVLPTAAAPDGAGVPERWATLGTDYFRGLGARPTAVMALERDDCFREDLVREVRDADLIYFSGGKPGHLLRTLSDTPLWSAVLGVLKRGGLLAGCSAGAMVLGGWIPGRFDVRRRSLWTPAMGLVHETVVLPHFDEMPGWVEPVVRRLMPPGAALLGLDGGTAVVVRGRRAQALGRGRVVVARRRGRHVVETGQPVDLQPPPG
jgi:cyanophycinase